MKELSIGRDSTVRPVCTLWTESTMHAMKTASNTTSTTELILQYNPLLLLLPQSGNRKRFNQDNSVEEVENQQGRGRKYGRFISRYSVTAILVLLQRIQKWTFLLTYIGHLGHVEVDPLFLNPGLWRWRPVPRSWAGGGEHLYVIGRHWCHGFGRTVACLASACFWLHQRITNL